MITIKIETQYTTPPKVTVTCNGETLSCIETLIIQGDRRPVCHLPDPDSIDDQEVAASIGETAEAMLHNGIDVAYTVKSAV